MNKSRIYDMEDLITLTENIPSTVKGPVTKMMMDIMNHDGYNNKK